MGKWFKVEVYRAHKKCSFNSATACIFADDAVVAFETYKGMRGVKRDVKIGDPFPNVLPMSEEEALYVEKKIVSENRISLEDARKTRYYIRMI